MAIKTIQSESLRRIWVNDYLSCLPNTYRYQVRDILFDLDAACKIEDLEDISAVQYDPDNQDCWSVSITVNSVEPCGAVVCQFWQDDCYNLELREYEP
jgi:hypothetical protein